MYENNCHASIIVLWSTSPPHHLEYVCDWVVYIALELAIKKLCALDNH